MNKLPLFFALTTLLTVPPVQAQNPVATPLHMSVREFLAGAFEGVKAKYVIGTGLDGELILSVSPTRLTPNQAFRVASLAVDYPIEHLIVDGIHVIRRKTSLSAEPDAAKKPALRKTTKKAKK